jgi:E3 ubiquitin-protein ligase RNF115/126
MADHPPRRGANLDATGPRDVVYCHQCSGEWYQDEHGLICPLCEGEITEIVSYREVINLSSSFLTNV